MVVENSEERSIPTVPSFSDAFRMVQDIGGRLSEAAKTMAEDFAQSPAAKFAEPMATLGSQIAELSTAWVSPVKAILEEQQALIDTVAAWAEQQQQLAERFAALAERHRTLTSQTMGVLQPILDQIEALTPKKPGQER